ncbi:MAG: hydantoinase/oxoprolinase N-terminal domain-containing protein [Caldilineaceae bacterium]
MRFTATNTSPATPIPPDGVIDGLRALLADQQIDGAQIDEIVHSTTLVTNAIIDRRGARAGLLTSAGFRHVLDLGGAALRHTRSLHHLPRSVDPRRPAP